MKSAFESSETVLVPVVGQVRMPLPSSKERAEFIAGLEEETEKIKRGHYTVFEKEAFIAWMLEGYKNLVQIK
jgi:hypothetical protein